MNQPEMETLLARQGIYDKLNAIYAYELLYRNKNNEESSDIDNTNERAGVRATSSVISQLFTNLNIDSVIGNKLAFINFNYSDLVQQTPRLLPKNRIVIEVLENIIIDQSLIANLRELHNDGYKIALDDFVYRDELIPLIEIANIIKLDVLNRTEKEILEQISPLKEFKGKLLAEKIDNRNQFNFCMDLGFEYFQGFFLNKPDNVKGHAITENRTQVLRVVSELNREDISAERVEEIILQIPKLCYRILRISNSVHYYTGKRNTSLNDAIYRLGLRRIRNWTNLLLMASNADIFPDLLERTLIRAKMCESLATALKYHKPHEAYTVGIFSMLDVMLNEPMSSLLDKIQLDNNISEALLHHKGMLGQLLKYTIDYEQANFSELEQFPFEKTELTKFYIQGIEYATTMLQIWDSQP